MRILCRQTPKASIRVTNLEMKDRRMRDARVDHRAAHGAKQSDR
jgi:hypothetical protein